MSTRRKTQIILGLIVLILVVVVTAQNSQPVIVRILFWSAQIDRAILFPGLFLSGLLFGFLMGIGVRRKRRPGAGPPA